MNDHYPAYQGIFSYTEYPLADSDAWVVRHRLPSINSGAMFQSILDMSQSILARPHFAHRSTLNAQCNEATPMQLWYQTQAAPKTSKNCINPSSTPNKRPSSTILAFNHIPIQPYLFQYILCPVINKLFVQTRGEILGVLVAADAMVLSALDALGAV